MPAYTHRATGTVSHNANSAALSPGAPAGVTSGDLLLLFTANYNSGETVTGTTGFVEIFSNASGNATTKIFARIADGTATDTPSPDWSGSADSLAWISAYSGDVYQGDLRGLVTTSMFETSAATVPRAPPNNPLMNDTMLVAFTVKRKTATSNDATTLTVPASGSFTKRQQVVQSGTALVAASADWQQTTSTAFDGTDWTIDGTAENGGGCGVILAIKTENGQYSTIFRDVATEDVRTGTTSPQTFSHAAASSGVKGVTLSIVHGTSSTDHVSAASYGGVAMARIQRNTDTATEPGAAEIWFLGSSVPQGTQTVSYTPGSTTDDIHAVCETLIAGGDLEVVDNDGINNNVANPSVTLTSGGREIFCVGALYGGGSAPSASVPNDPSQMVHEHDFGAFYSQCIDTVSSRYVDIALGTTASTDDVAYAAIAISPVAVVHEGSGTPSLPLLTATGTGKKTRKGSGTPTLPLLTAAGEGDVTPSTVTHEGSGTPSLPLVTASGTGKRGLKSTGAPELPLLTASGAGKKTRKGTGTPSLPLITASGAAKRGLKSTGAPSLPLLTAAGEGKKTRKGTGTPSLPILTASGVGKRALKGTGEPVLPLLTAEGAGILEGVLVGEGAATLPILVASGSGTVISLTVETGQTPAGSNKQKRRYIVEIDGREFTVSSLDEALSLLNKAQDLAIAEAEKRTEKQVKASLPKALKLGKVAQVQAKTPDIRVPPELQKQLDEKVREIKRIYRDAALNAELRILMALEAERDDEDVLLLM